MGGVLKSTPVKCWTTRWQHSAPLGECLKACKQFGRSRCDGYPQAPQATQLRRRGRPGETGRGVSFGRIGKEAAHCRSGERAGVGPVPGMAGWPPDGVAALPEAVASGPEAVASGTGGVEAGPDRVEPLPGGVWAVPGMVGTVPGVVAALPGAVGPRPAAVGAGPAVVPAGTGRKEALPRRKFPLPWRLQEALAPPDGARPLHFYPMFRWNSTKKTSSLRAGG